KNPPTLDAGTASLKAQIPFLVDSATLGRFLTPAAIALRGALPTLNSALEVGTRVTRRTPILYSNLQQAMNALKNLAESPTTNAGAADCEYGQRGYIKRSPHAPPGLNVATDPHNEVGYPAGPTYAYEDAHGGHGHGPTQVPAGETFTREPGGIGAQLDANL